MNIITDLPPTTTNETVAIDIETFGQEKKRLHRPEGRLASLQICIGDTVYMMYDDRTVDEALWRVKDCMWVFQNAMFDLRQLRRWTDIPQRPIWDTFLMEKDLWGGYYDTFSLLDMARRYLDIRLDKSIREEIANSTTMTEEQIRYAAEDAFYTLRIQQAQEEIIRNEHRDMRCYWEIDEPAIWSFLDANPIGVDVERWENLAEEFGIKGYGIQDTELGGLNVYAYAKVKQFLVGKRIITDKQNTKASTLEPLRLEYPEVDAILRARTYRKADNTYGAGWIKKHVEEGNLVYSNVVVTQATTGRSAYRNPNLQNIPSRKMPEYRELFIPSVPGNVLTVIDISQQEPRETACVSGDKELRRIFLAGEDVHLMVARAIYRDDSITKGDPRRQIGKTINLAITYGMSAYTLAEDLGISITEAEQFVKYYFTKFPGVRIWIHQQEYLAHRQGYVETRAGRRSWINTYKSNWRNNAVNSPIQGGGGDITKSWINYLHDYCNRKNITYPFNMQIHDEIVIEHAPGEEEVYIPVIVDGLNEIASNLYPEVPFVCEYATGANWGVKK